MRTINITINNQKWKLLLKPLHETLHGECDPDNKVIYINSLLPPNQRLEIMIHELLHAVYPFLEEETIDNAAIDISKALRKCGINSVGEAPPRKKNSIEKPKQEDSQ